MGHSHEAPQTDQAVPDPHEGVGFEFQAVTDRPKPGLCRLKAVVGVGDQSEPLTSIKLFEQD